MLRQSLIALRLAEQAGVADEDMVSVYYTGLLVNVGCDSDAHEHGEVVTRTDIVVKADTYQHGVHGVTRR